MNAKKTTDDWSELKNKIKSRFGKLTDEAVDSVQDNLDLLSSKLQKFYGYAREQAEKELKSFKATLHEATEPDKKTDSKPTIKVVS